MKVRKMLCLSALLVFAGTMAFAAGRQGQKLKVGFCPMDLSNPFFAQMVASARATAQQNNVELVVTDGKSDPQQQVVAVENYISQGCKVIIVIPVDGESLKSVIEEAEKRGIPVITHTTKVDAATAYVSIDEWTMGNTVGEAAGQWIASKLGGNAEYAILNQPTLPQIIRREKGIQDGIAKYAPNAKLVATVAAWLPDLGMKAAENILQAHPNVKVIVGINDSGALGAYEAVNATNVNKNEFFIGGVDGTSPAIEKIAAGAIYRATVDIGPVPTGKLLVEYAIKLSKGETVPAETWVQTKAVTIDNVKEYQ